MGYRTKAEQTAYNKAYYASHREEARERNRQYNETHKDAIARQRHDYRQAHLTEEHAHHQSYYQSHKAEITAQHQQYKEAHRADVRRRDAKYRAAHRERARESVRRCKDNLKREVMVHYGNGKAACVICGYNADIEALVIDHINGGGKRERQSAELKTKSFYASLKKRGWPTGYQTLCSNCNTIKAKRNNEHKNGHTKGE